MEKYAKNKREWQIYNKRLGIQWIKIKENKWAKYYLKLKLPKRNIYRQNFCFDFPLIYYLVITSKLK